MPLEGSLPNADSGNVKVRFHGEEGFGLVELLMAMEDEFGVKIPDDEAEHIHTVGQAIELVHTKLNS